MIVTPHDCVEDLRDFEPRHGNVLKTSLERLRCVQEIHPSKVPREADAGTRELGLNAEEPPGTEVHRGLPADSDQRTAISTRRFVARPAAVLFETFGEV